MITITPAAARQIKLSAEQGSLDGLPLRIAVTRMDDGTFHYAMGFDEAGKEGDEVVQSEGIDVVVSMVSVPFLKGTTLDFAELDDGQQEFIFLNPNDPAYQPPVGDN